MKISITFTKLICGWPSPLKQLFLFLDREQRKNARIVNSNRSGCVQFFKKGLLITERILSYCIVFPMDFTFNMKMHIYQAFNFCLIDFLLEDSF